MNFYQTPEHNARCQHIEVYVYDVAVKVTTAFIICVRNQKFRFKGKSGEAVVSVRRCGFDEGCLTSLFSSRTQTAIQFQNDVYSKVRQRQKAAGPQLSLQLSIT